MSAASVFLSTLHEEADAQYDKQQPTNVLSALQGTHRGADELYKSVHPILALTKFSYSPLTLFVITLFVNITENHYNN